MTPPFQRLGALGVPVAAGVVHSVLAALAFPPAGLWGFAFAAPLPLIAVGVRRPRAHLAWTPVLAGMGTLPLWAYQMQWVFPVSALGYLPLIVALGLFTGLPVGLLMLVRRRWPGVPVTIVAPVTWVGLEFLRGEVAFDGFPWLLMGYPAIDAPGLALPASSLGVYFVSFLVVTIGCAAAEVGANFRGSSSGESASFATGHSERRQGRVGPTIVWCSGVALVAVLAGVLGARDIRTATPVQVGVVQTNVPQDNKIGWTVEQRLADWDRMAAMTREAGGGTPRPAMIVWPETMFPGEFLDGPSVDAQRRSGLGIPYTDAEGRERLLLLTEFVDRLTSLQADLGIPMVVGALAADNLRFVESGTGGVRIEFDRRYNSAFVIDHGRPAADRYDKLALTPFGEVMPYISNWAWLERQLLALGARGMTFDLSPGRGPATLSVRASAGAVRLAAPICFEAVKTAVVRRLARDADVIVNLTNDGWFSWFDGARRQHLQIARWRAAELGRPVVRSANTGVSCFIDHRGRVVSAAPPRAEAVLLASVTPTTGRTIYARIGNVFGWSVLAAVGSLAVGAGWREVRSSKVARGPGGVGESSERTKSVR